MSAEPDATMTFFEHLAELRGRLVKMALAFVIGAGIAWWQREPLLLWITKPFVDGWNSEGGALPALHFPAPQSLFVAYLKLSMLGGLVLALPVMLYQLWAFIAPGLYSREKRLAIPFVLSSTTLFVVGAYFCWRVASPLAFKYLLGFSGPVGGTGFEVRPTVMIGDYIEFVSHFLVAFGAVFELPVLVFFLSIAGIVNHRHLIKFFRYFVVIAFVLGAILTPPDVISQLLLAVPLCVLYGISIIISWAVARKRETGEESAAAE